MQLLGIFVLFGSINFLKACFSLYGKAVPKKAKGPEHDHEGKVKTLSCSKSSANETAVGFKLLERPIPGLKICLQCSKKFTDCRSLGDHGDRFYNGTAWPIKVDS
jgi:hypothetical protein